MRPFLVALVLVAGTIPATAQWLDRPTPGIPRTADGKPNLTAPAPRAADGKPDLTGIWNSPALVARPEAAALQPWVGDLAVEHQQDFFKMRPYYSCRPSGPEAERFGSWKRILQTPTVLAILSDDLTYRVIHTDGRTLEDEPAPSWSGYSVARWEGDTLVVESNGFNDKTWASRYGISHTEALRMTERYKRSDFGHLQIEVTYTDPGAYTRPWGFKLDMTLAADTEMLEAICERSSEHWAGSLTDAASKAVTVPSDVLAKYVGVYSGIYQGNTRTVAVSLSGAQLIVKTVGANAGGSGAGDAEESAPRTLVPRTQTLFEGLGLGYNFVVDANGVATDLEEIHISGRYRYPRLR
jgi:hypothetical protein